MTERQHILRLPLPPGCFGAASVHELNISPAFFWIHVSSNQVSSTSSYHVPLSHWWSLQASAQLHLRIETLQRASTIQLPIQLFIAVNTCSRMQYQHLSHPVTCPLELTCGSCDIVLHVISSSSPSLTILLARLSQDSYD